MRTWRRITALILILMMAMSMAACGDGISGDKADSTSNNPNAESVAPAVESDSSDSTGVIESASEAESDSNRENDSSKAFVSDEPFEEASDSTDESTEQVAEPDADETAGEEEVTNYYFEPGAAYEETEDNDNGMTPTQRNSINMLNYMSSLTQKVNAGKGNQLFLESTYDSFDNLYPNSVDRNTQAQIASLMDTIQDYRMISVKRDRLVYIYEQNRAQALRQAIPNPIGLLSAVQSGSLLKAAASVLYMAVDSASSYNAATSQADLQFIKDGWELDDAEANALHNSTKNALNYLYDMVRNYDLPGDYALGKEAIEDFVTWSSKPDSQRVGKIQWFEDHKGDYSEFGPYWLEMAKDYYNDENHEKCLDAVRNYEAISTRIFRKDIDYASILPMAIISAKETLSSEDYVKLASQYCSVIHDNTKDKDWTLRFFVAQIYMDLYAITKEESYIDSAYSIARENVVVLVDEQRELNASYLAEVEEAEADKDATKREKKEVKNYNKLLKDERKIALPPVSEALYLNCDLLFALAKQKSISSTDQQRIENILHENGESIFLTKALDDRFWFSDSSGAMKADDVSADFDGRKFSIPASCVTDRSDIVVTVSGADGNTTFKDWSVKEVKRPKNSKDCSEFMVSIDFQDIGKYKFKDGEIVTIKVIPVEESPEQYLEFKFNVVAAKKAFVFNGIKFERVK